MIGWYVCDGLAVHPEKMTPIAYLETVGTKQELLEGPPVLGDEYVLLTQLSVDECTARLRAHVRSARSLSVLMALPQERPVAGKVKGERFRLWRCFFQSPYRHARPSHYGNAFGTVVSGELVSMSDGTEVRGKTGLPIESRYVYGGMLAVAVVFSVLTGMAWGVPLLILGWAFTVWVMYLIGRWFGQDDEEILLNFLRRTLEAHDVAYRHRENGTTRLPWN
ncbi:MAG: hypothetical protein M1305_02420 [Candidatus Marsarchaeota archaeon]|nr:hypothetical protein [Candidatus Marsarchaeota archaeon]